MAISFSCPNCGKVLTVSDAHAGARGKCRYCRQPVTAPMASEEEASQSFGERDNRGTREETWEEVSSYWEAQKTQGKSEPFVRYAFPSASAAGEALSELPCVHRATDSCKLICTEPLYFGCYRNKDGQYEALIAGEALTVEVWQAAMSVFRAHSGTYIGDRMPPKTTSSFEPVQTTRSTAVQFVREEQQIIQGSMMVYQIHSSPNEASARLFLESVQLDDPSLRVIVQTPDGTFARDAGGIFKE